MSKTRTLLAILPLVVAATVTGTIALPATVRAETWVEDMSPGMAKAFVRGIQEELTTHGYQPGPSTAPWDRAPAPPSAGINTMPNCR